MTFLLDTNAIIVLLKGQQPFLKRLQQHRPDAFVTSAVVVQELFYGAYKSRRVEDWE